MWMAQENLVANLIAQEKWEEALPIFLKVCTFIVNLFLRKVLFLEDIDVTLII